MSLYSESLFSCAPHPPSTDRPKVSLRCQSASVQRLNSRMRKALSETDTPVTQRSDGFFELTQRLAAKRVQSAQPVSREDSAPCQQPKPPTFGFTPSNTSDGDSSSEMEVLSPDAYGRPQVHLKDEEKYKFFRPRAIIVRRARERMKIYRESPVEQQRLAARVQQYRLEKQRLFSFPGGTSSGNFIERYVQRMAQKPVITPRRTAEEWKRRNDDIMLTHLVSARLAFESQKSHRIHALKRHDEIKAMAEKERGRAEKNEAAINWIVLISQALRGEQFRRRAIQINVYHIAKANHQCRQQYFFQWFVPVRHKLHRQRRCTLLQRVRFAVCAALLWGHIARRRKSASTIKILLSGVREAGLFYSAVRRFRAATTLIQRTVRKYQRYRTIRVNLIHMAWIPVEARVRAARHVSQVREKVVSGESGPDSSARSRQRARGASARISNRQQQLSGEDAVRAQISELLSDDPFSFTAPIPFTLRHTMILADWTKRRAEYLAHMVADHLKEKTRRRSHKKTHEIKYFPFLPPKGRLEEMVSAALDKFKEIVTDAKQCAANAVVRAGRGTPVMYSAARDNEVSSRFVIEKEAERRFKATVNRALYGDSSARDDGSMKLSTAILRGVGVGGLSIVPLSNAQLGTSPSLSKSLSRHPKVAV